MKLPQEENLRNKNWKNVFLQMHRRLPEEASTWVVRKPGGRKRLKERVRTNILTLSVKH